MDPNGMQGGMYSTMGSGMLGLEMSLHHPPHPQSQNPLTPSFLGQNPHPQMSPCPQQDPNFRNPNRPSKPQQFTISDEDEPGLGPEDSGCDKRKFGSSPWQRMKWTDNMVKLLILVVYCIGDEAGPEGGEASGKKKGGACGGGGGVLQKKGKWKSVSRAMLERGFYVSPQQCEDKFNDLNKRYKRVNDILGKGMACRVVENQSLLDTMDNLTAKKKEEVKKLLNSKHLFFKEMCAYHTSASGGCGSGGPHQPELAESAPRQQVGCRHSPGEATFGALLDRKDFEETKMLKRGNKEEEMDENEHDEDHRDEDEDDDDNIDDGDEECSKRAKTSGFAHSALIQQLSGELASVVHDMSKSPVEKKHWVQNRMIRLEEKRVGFQLESFELEKQRLKWLKFSSKKEREMEREKLQSERSRLEIDRMLLLLRQKEFELLDNNQASNISG